MSSKLPEKYHGAEFIRTFNSKQDGFEVKLEVFFFVEQATEFFVALIKDASSEFLEGFWDTGDTMFSYHSCIYRIFMRVYEDGVHVHIPNFSRDFHHFVVWE